MSVDASAMGGGGGGESNPYVSLGLIDPSTYDETSVPGYGTEAESDSELDETEQEPAAPNWDDDQNPYKGQVAQLQRQMQAFQQGSPAQALQQTEQGIVREAGTLYQQLLNGPVAQGEMKAEHAQVLVNMAAQQAIQQARHQAERQALLPAAKQEVASRIAKEFSAGNAKVDPAQLLGEPTVEAMKARAKTIQEFSRNQGFQGRAAKRVDRAESGSVTGLDSRAIEGLSPSAKIKLGIIRGHGK